jgi:uncharacterized membrane protein
MTWFVYAILARLFWGFCNLLDQYITRYFGNKSIVAPLLVEYFAVVPITIVMGFLIDRPLALTTSSLFWLGLGAVTNIIALVPYFLAIKQDEMHNIAPFFELTPVFVTIFAYLLLGDTIAPLQMVGAALIIGCSALLAWDFKRGRIRKLTLTLLVAAALLWASGQLSLRFVAPHESAWRILFYFCLIHSVLTPFIWLFTPKATQRLVKDVLRQTNGKILLPAFAEELCLVIAEVFIITAYAQAPGAGYVAALSGLQSVFILLTTLALGLLGVHHFERLVWDREMKIKCVLLAGIVAGTYLLGLA